MNDRTLTALFDADRQRLEAALRQDRTLPAALQVLDKALNRLQLQYMEANDDRLLRDAAQAALETMRDALPLLEGVSEARAWKREAPAAASKRRIGPAAIAMLAAGGALVLGALMTLRAANPLTMAACLVCAAAGGGLLVFGGRALAAPPRTAAPQESDTRTELLVDPEALTHRLRGMLMAADARLERRSSEAQAEAALPAARTPTEAVALSDDPVELLSDLLETAYALKGTPAEDDAAEMIAGIRYYLHGQGIEAVDHDAENKAWFELLPSPRPGTMRPALVREGKLVRKGLAGEEL